MLAYLVALVRRTRTLPGVILGGSSRAAIHLMGASKANARINNRDYVTVEDVRAMAPYVLRHRMILDPGVSADDILRLALASVEA